jgi:hypothetical protein
LIAEFSEFWEINQHMSRDQYRFNGHYLIVLLKGDISDAGEIFKVLWEFKIYNVNLIFDKNSTILSVTFMPFNAENCNDTSPVVINEFKDGKFINGIENIFPAKMRNLHKCEVRVATSNDNSPYVIVKHNHKGVRLLSGRDISLMTTLSERLNFSINYTYVGIEGFLFENGSANGGLKILLDQKADVSVSNWWLKGYRMNFFDATTSYISEKIVFVIPPAQDLTSIQKLIYPFTTPAWIVVILCFSVGYAVIFIIKLLPKSFQNFVFGANVRHPYLNIFIAIIGGTQKVLPRRNFGRFLLMMLLMLFLVVRTLYQGSFYQLLKSDRHHKEIQSINEMIEKDFDFYVYSGSVDVFAGTPAIEKRFYLLFSSLQSIFRIFLIAELKFCTRLKKLKIASQFCEMIQHSKELWEDH